jgi:hypothetical protein
MAEPSSFLQILAAGSPFERTGESQYYISILQLRRPGARVLSLRMSTVAAPNSSMCLLCGGPSTELPLGNK